MCCLGNIKGSMNDDFFDAVRLKFRSSKMLFACAATILTCGSAFAQTNSSQADILKTNVIATVLGKEIFAGEKENLGRLIFGALLGQFAQENKIEPTDEELDAFVIAYEAKSKQDHIAKNSHEMDAEMRSMKRELARTFVGMWKINRALYHKYGGRVIFQQSGPEPLDAYREFLKHQEKQGNFQIIDKSLEEDFWRYYTTSSMHVFYQGDEAAKFIETPWWVMEEATGQ